MTAKEGGEGAQSRFASALLNLGATYVHFGESKVSSASLWKLHFPAHITAVMLMRKACTTPPALAHPCQVGRGEEERAVILQR